MSFMHINDHQCTFGSSSSFKESGSKVARMFLRGFNDTDILGKAPPMIRAVDFAKRWCRFDNKSTAKWLVPAVEQCSHGLTLGS